MSGHDPRQPLPRAPPGAPPAETHDVTVDGSLGSLPSNAAFLTDGQAAACGGEHRPCSSLPVEWMA